MEVTHLLPEKAAGFRDRLQELLEGLKTTLIWEHERAIESARAEKSAPQDAAEGCGLQFPKELAGSSSSTAPSPPPALALAEAKPMGPALSSNDGTSRPSRIGRSVSALTPGSKSSLLRVPDKCGISATPLSDPRRVSLIEEDDSASPRTNSRKPSMVEFADCGLPLVSSQTMPAGRRTPFEGEPLTPSRKASMVDFKDSRRPSFASDAIQEIAATSPGAQRKKDFAKAQTQPTLNSTTQIQEVTFSRTPSFKRVSVISAENDTNATAPKELPKDIPTPKRAFGPCIAEEVAEVDGATLRKGGSKESDISSVQDDVKGSNDDSKSEASDRSNRSDPSPSKKPQRSLVFGETRSEKSALGETLSQKSSDEGDADNCDGNPQSSPSSPSRKLCRDRAASFQSNHSHHSKTSRTSHQSRRSTLRKQSLGKSVNDILQGLKKFRFRSDEDSEDTSSSSSSESEESAAGGHGSDDGDEVESEDEELHYFWLFPVWADTSERAMRKSTLHAKSHESLLAADDDDKGGHVFERMVMRPSSAVRLPWLAVGIIVLAFDCIWIPLQFFKPPASPIWNFTSFCLRFYWIVDVPISFLTGVPLKHGEIEMRPLYVARRYLLSWFLFDLFMIFYDWIEAAVGLSTGMRVLRLARVAKMMKVVQLQGLGMSFSRFGERFLIIASIVRIMVVILFFCHILACLWYAVGTEEENDLNWVTHFGYVTESWSELYLISFLCAICQIAGEITLWPQGILERVYLIFTTIICYIFSACAVSMITTSMTRLQIVTAKQSTMYAELRMYLHANAVSEALSQRIQRNVHRAVECRARNMDEKNIELLGFVSESLLVELHYEINFPELAVHPFFRCYNRVYLAAMQQICHSALGRLHLHTGDVLFHYGETADVPRMFFVTEGRMLYLHFGKEDQRKTVKLGSWACEPALWTLWSYRGTMRAKTDCTVLWLDSNKFQKVTCQFLTKGCNIVTYGQTLIRFLNQKPRTDLSDLKDQKMPLGKMAAEAMGFVQANDLSITVHRTSVHSAVSQNGVQTSEASAQNYGPSFANLVNNLKSFGSSDSSWRWSRGSVGSSGGASIVPLEGNGETVRFNGSNGSSESLGSQMARG